MAINAEQNQQEQQNALSNNNQTNNTSSTAPADSGPSGTNISGSSGSPEGSSQNSRIASFSSGASPNTQGSGRYTNLQKYIGANAGAGDRLAQGIGKNVNDNLDQNQQTAQTSADSVRQGIQAAQDKLQTGQGYLNQMQQTGFNAQDFVSDPNKLNDFTSYRTNQAVNPTDLTNQQAQAQSAYQTAQTNAQNELNNVSTEQGRYGLLQDTFGGKTAYKPTYSTGQQRLDQLFLQAAPGNNINQLQDQVKNNISGLNQGLDQFNQSTTPLISNVGTQASTLATGLQNQSNTLGTNYLGDLSKTATADDAIRAQQQKDFTNAYNTLVGKGTPGQPINDDIYNQLLATGVKNNEQTFNVLKDPTLTAQNVINFDPTTALTAAGGNPNELYKSVANQQNIDYYNALSQLKGTQNTDLTQLGALIDPTTGQLKAGANWISGDGSLADRINQAKNEFMQNAKQDNVTGIYSNSTAKDISNNADQIRQAQAYGAFGQGGLMMGSLSDPNSFRTLYGAGQGYGERQNINDYLTSDINNATRNNDLYNAPKQGLINATQNQINNYLNQQGFTNYINQSGAQSDAGKSYDQILKDLGYGQADLSNAGVYQPPKVSAFAQNDLDNMGK